MILGSCAFAVNLALKPGKQHEIYLQAVMSAMTLEILKLQAITAIST